MESLITLEISEIFHTKVAAGFDAFIENRTDLILPRLADCESKAIAECLERYGNLIWNLVKKQIRVADKTEETVCEIFQDIWKSAHLFDAEKHDEQAFVALIALRRLLKITDRTKIL